MSNYMFNRTNVHDHVSGVPGAAFTRHPSREAALAAFLAARRQGAVQRVGRFDPAQEVLELTDTDSGNEA